MAFLKAGEAGWRVIVAAAGLSAALPGVVASLVKQPVIGIPLVAGSLSGIDALMSILQLPKGVPVATMGIGKQGVLNAVPLAERILRVGTPGRATGARRQQLPSTSNDAVRDAVAPMRRSSRRDSPPPG